VIGDVQFLAAPKRESDEEPVAVSATSAEDDIAF